MPRVPLFPVTELPPGARRLVRVGRVEIGVFNIDGTVVAYRNVCPHAGAPVCEGGVSGTTVPSGVYEYKLGLAGRILRCPWHGWEFDLRTGGHLVDPETRLKNFPVGTGVAPGAESLDSFPVRREDDFLFVEVPG